MNVFTRRSLPVALSLLLVAPVVAAQPTFSDADLEGTYAFSLIEAAKSSTSISESGVSITAAGVFSADGAGNILAGLRTKSIAGRLPWNGIVDQVFSGSYTIDSDGTGVMQIRLNPKNSGSQVDHEIYSLALVNQATVFLSGVADENGRYRIIHGLARRQGDDADSVLADIRDLLDSLPDLPDLSAIEGKLEQILANQGVIQGDLTQIRADEVQSLANQLEILADVDDLKVDVADLASQVDANGQAIVENGTKLATVEGMVAANGQAIAENGGKLDLIDGKIEANGRGIAENAVKVDRVEGKVDANALGIAENGVKLVRLESKVDELLARFASLDSKQCEAIRLLLTPEGRRASACCDEEISFPNGKDAPTCGGSM